MALQIGFVWVSQVLFGYPKFRLEDLTGVSENMTVNILNLIIRTANLTHLVRDRQLLKYEMSEGLRVFMHPKKSVNTRKHRAVLTWDELFLLNEEYAWKIWNFARNSGYSYKWNYTTFDETTRHSHPFAINPKQKITC